MFHAQRIQYTVSGSTPHSIPQDVSPGPSGLLPDDDSMGPLHDCPEVADMIQSIRPDLTDIPLVTPGEELFTSISHLWGICALFSLDCFLLSLKKVRIMVKSWLE